MFDSKSISSLMVQRFVKGHDIVDLYFQKEKEFYVELTREGIKKQVPFYAPFNKFKSLTPDELMSIHTYSVQVEYSGKFVTFDRLLLGGGRCCSSESEEPIHEPLIGDNNNEIYHAQQQPAQNDGNLFVGIHSSSHLANRLQKEKDVRLKKLALDIVEVFSRRKNVTRFHIKEITDLVVANDQEVTQAVLKSIFTKMEESPFLEVELLEGLRDALQQVRKVEYLLTDRLLVMLRTLKMKYDKYCNSGQPLDMYRVIKALSQVLSSIGDSNLKAIGFRDPKVKMKGHEGISYDDDIKPFYLQLNEKLVEDENWRIAIEARYASQALIRIGHDTSKVRLIVNGAVRVLEGVGHLKDVFLNKSPSELLRAYKSLKEGYKGLKYVFDTPQTWYDEFRIIKFLATNNGDLSEYHKYLSNIDHKEEHVEKMLAVIALELCDEIFDDSSRSRLEALTLLEPLYYALRNFSEPSKALKISHGDLRKKVQVGILTTLRESLGDDDLRTTALGILHQMNKNVSQDEIAYFRSVIPEKPENLSIKPKMKYPNEKLNSTELFEEVIQKHLNNSNLVLDMEERFFQMYRKALKNYIPLRGTLTKGSSEFLSLDLQIETFLKGSQQVLLILGEQGSGKTFFARNLALQLWEKHPSLHKDLPIPLYIPLSQYNNHSLDVIKETLKEAGFKNSQIQAFRKTGQPFLFIIDEWDQMINRIDLQNLVTKSGLSGKIILLARPEALPTKSKDRALLFVDRSQRNLYEELWIAPFSEKEIQHYVERQQSQGLTPWDYQKYNQYFKVFEGLLDLARNPFFLSLICELLPNKIEELIKEGTLSQSLVSIQIAMLEEYTDAWLHQAENRLSNHSKMAELRSQRKQFIKECKKYCKKLASDMMSKNVTSLIINRDEMQADEYFYLAAAPVTMIEDEINNTIQVQFINKLLRNYFLFLAEKMEMKVNQQAPSQDDEKEPAVKIVLPEQIQVVIPTIDKVDISLSIRLLNREPSLIQFYAEEVQKNPTFKKMLFSLVENSKSDASFAIAAANAMTILNAARCSFSGMDFSGARIRGAILIGAICHKTIFAKADVRDVIFRNAILDESDFTDSLIDGISFGEQKISLQNFSDRSWAGGVETYFTAISPDGNKIGGISVNRMIIWEIKSGQVIYQEKSQGEKFTFSKDGKKVIVSSCHFGLAEIDIATKGIKKYQQPPEFLPKSNSAPAVSSSGKYVSYTVGDKFFVCDESGQCIKTFSKKDPRACYFSPDETVFIGVLANQIVFWDLKSGQEIKIINIPKKEGDVPTFVTAVTLSRDGKFLVTGLNDGRVIIWDLSQGIASQILVGHSDQIKSCTFSHEQDQLATIGLDGALRVWNINSGKTVQVIPYDVQKTIYGDGKKDEKGFPIGQVCQFSDEGDSLVVMSLEGQLSTFALSNESYLKFTPFPKLEKCGVLANGKKGIATTGNETWIFDLENGRVLKNIKGLSAGHHALVSPRGNFFTGRSEKGLHIINSDTYEQVTLIVYGHIIEELCFSQDEKRIFIKSRADNRVRIDQWSWNISCWDTTSGNSINLNLNHSFRRGFSEVVFNTSKTEGVFAIVRPFEQKEKFKYNLETQAMEEIKGPVSGISNVSQNKVYSDDRKMYVSREQSGFTVYDVLKGEKPVLSQKGYFSTFLFSPDSRKMAVSSSTKPMEIIVYELDGSGKFLKLEVAKGSIFYDFFFTQSGQLVALDTNGGYKNEVKEGRIIVWEVEKGTMLVETKLPSFIKTYAFSKASGELFIGCSNNEISIWKYGQDIRRQPFFRLNWCSLPTLRMKGANFNGAIGLIEEDMVLLQNHGAIPIHSKVPYERKEEKRND